MDCGKNEDVEIWRKIPGDYYSPSIHVTKSDGIGINVGGLVIVKPIEEWMRLATEKITPKENSKEIVDSSTPQTAEKGV